MGTGRKFNKKPVSRPKKNACERKRRDNVHKKRLVALGMSEEDVKHITSKGVTKLLKRPKQTAAIIAKKATVAKKKTK